MLILEDGDFNELVHSIGARRRLMIKVSNMKSTAGPSSSQSMVLQQTCIEIDGDDEVSML